jgi:signal transduction histidine kinase
VRVEIGRPDATTDAEAPAVRVDVLETVVQLLGRVESDGSSDAFYSSLCEAVCRVSAMDRAVIFRYDATRRRVRAAGAYGLSLDRFAEAHVTVESAPIARQALEEDRVIDVDAEVARRELPATFHDLLDDATLVCAPLSAGGRWSGVILADRRPRRALSDEERHVLWTLGKISSLAEAARSATFQSLRARQLQERIDLAREVHEGVIQRLFGVTLAFSSEAELPREARERIVVELQAALRDLRRALQRPLGRSAPETGTTLLAEIERLQRAHPDLGLRLTPASRQSPVPRALEPLAQSVLAEAVRNAHKHATPRRVEVSLHRQDGLWTMEVCNDGVHGRPRSAGVGMGLKLAALEALQAGGIVEFGEREPGSWRVRLAVPLERP